ncbi:lipoyl synthase [Paenibacillus zanthoxyli]|uniref:lipoyl synthase n=1 Tax=Paenibacillus zanthoxyli TaxID=369399 RepID=UPI00047100EB|nr:lipoyl synthase [Paenibacillus zanthoxyli]
MTRKETAKQPKPDWIRIKLTTGENYQDIKGMMRSKTLHTVCEEARCPNIYECWANRTATFMILGDICTRACRFCAVNTGMPTELDLQEPERVAEAAGGMNLRHCVVTSVARDDLKDGGAKIFAETVAAIRRRLPLCSVEVLIPDFLGDQGSLQIVMDSNPDILNHNIETVERMSDRVRAKAKYRRSLELLRRAKEMKPNIPTKSSIMLGVGEEWDEILQAMDDLREVDCDILTLGQYLQPSPQHLDVVKYYPPEEFVRLKEEGLKRGFSHVEAGPLVRSSYHAHEQVESAAKTRGERTAAN